MHQFASDPPSATNQLRTSILFIRHRKNRVGHPPSKIGVVAELLVKLHIVLEHRHHDALERFAVLYFRILLVGVLFRVLIRLVGRDLCRDFFGHQLSHAVAIRLRDIAELIVEELQDVREPIEFRRRRARYENGRGFRPWGRLGSAWRRLPRDLRAAITPTWL